MYEVIVAFRERFDSDHIYNVGDTYPRKGFMPEQSRIDELLDGTNRSKQVFLKQAETLPPGNEDNTTPPSNEGNGDANTQDTEETKGNQDVPKVAEENATEQKETTSKGRSKK